MRNTAITAVVTAVLAFGIALGVCNWIVGQANEAVDARDTAYTALEKRATDSAFYWIDTASRLTDEKTQLKKNAKLFADDWNAQVKRLSDEKAVLKSKIKKVEAERKGWIKSSHEFQLEGNGLFFENKDLKAEIAEWEACAAKRNAEPDPDPTPEPEPAFTDLVQESLKGVVHLQAPSWQGSGFVVGPRLIATARHCVEDVEDFLITTADGHQVRATRAISDKEHDVAFVWVDDLRCVAGERGTTEHEVVLIPLPTGSIKDCVLGQSVYVIGSPFGKKHFNALTMGVVSMTTMDVENYGVGERYGWASLFMADAATWGGSSGCPVFTLDGIVRGVLVGGHGREENTSYCVPIDVILPIFSKVPLMFLMDRYEREEATGYSDERYNYRDGNENYRMDND